jgi:hypothetical protein
MVEGMKAKATKRSAPRRKKASKVVAYVAKWDPQRQRFIALDDKGVLLGLSGWRAEAVFSSYAVIPTPTDRIAR